MKRLETYTVAIAMLAMMLVIHHSYSRKSQTATSIHSLEIKTLKHLHRLELMQTQVEQDKLTQKSNYLINENDSLLAMVSLLKKQVTENKKLSSVELVDVQPVLAAGSFYTGINEQHSRETIYNCSPSKAAVMSRNGGEYTPSRSVFTTWHEPKNNDTILNNPAGWPDPQLSVTGQKANPCTLAILNR